MSYSIKQFYNLVDSAFVQYSQATTERQRHDALNSAIQRSLDQLLDAQEDEYMLKAIVNIYTAFSVNFREIARLYTNEELKAEAINCLKQIANLVEAKVQNDDKYFTSADVFYMVKLLDEACIYNRHINNQYPQ